MNRMKMALVALCASAICACALGTAGASAATGWQWEECLHETPPHTVTQFTGATCTEPGFGGWYWTHVVINPGRLRWTNGTTAISLASTVAGVEFEIQCANQSGEGEGEEGEAEGATVDRVTGLAISYEECAAKKPTGGVCTVPSTITTNSLKAETIPGVMSVKYAPTSGTTIATITVSGVSCPPALKGSKSLTGTETAAANEEAGIEEFTSTSGSALKFGGQTATLLARAGWCTPASGSGRRDRVATN